jgi:adenylate cyclase
MESTGEVGKIQVSPQVHGLLQEEFDLQPRGEIYIRGKGPMQTWFLLGRKTPMHRH